MQAFLEPLKELADYQEIVSSRRKKTGFLQIAGCVNSQKIHLAKALSDGFEYRVIVFSSEEKAKQAYEEWRVLEENVWFYPARDLLFYHADIKGAFLTGKRMEVLRAIVEKKGREAITVVTTMDAFLDGLPSKEELCGNRIKIHAEEALDFQKLQKNLSILGYERENQVESPGQFAVRGGILDVFPLTEENPVRIELWGDEVDSIRSFDVESQRSTENLQEIEIYPATENWKQMETESFLAYFPVKETILFLDEPVRLQESAEIVEKEYFHSLESREEAGMESEEIPIQVEQTDHTIGKMNKYYGIAFTMLESKCGMFKVRSVYSLQVKTVNPYNSSFELLTRDLKKLKRTGYRVILVSGSRTRAKRLAENIKDYGLLAYFAADFNRMIEPGEIMVASGRLENGFEYPAIRFVVLSEKDIFKERKVKKKKKKSQYSGQKINSLSEISVGDYVVHERYGLGIYRGMEKIEADGITKDYINIEYKDASNLFIPASQLELIQKYSSLSARKPKLNKLGGTEWEKTKSRVRSQVQIAAQDLVKLYAERQAKEGYSYGKDTVWQKEFEELFPYEETEDQLNAIEDTKRDMESHRIMDRLICGDVGYGKTEVAIRAAFKAVMDSKQVVYLVPTTILAQQHYNSFKERMEHYPIEIAMLSRFCTPKEQKRILDGLKNGSIDIVIGTHKVLSKSIKYKNLGLLIIDEEQRFGVKQKEKIKQLKKDVDVLALSATPIPRTLHMSLAGIRDMSVLEVPPVDRRAIQTYVMEYNEELVREAIERELGRGGQVYYVYNRVNNIDEVAAQLQKLLPDATVEYAHGQMGERQLESIMTGFINKEIDVLVSTTIIETGLDIPNVNTMIIQDAQLFGLSQLYQLRGRVGRSNRTAYAFLMYRRNSVLKEEAEKRLKAIREFTDLGSGFKIAMRDLEIRGAGNLLGAEQSGHMESVGYDLYCKMLNEAVLTMKGEQQEVDTFTTSIDLSINAYIPETYIKSEAEKLSWYKRIAAIETEEEYEDMIEELTDRYGDPPKPLLSLMDVALLREEAHQAWLLSIEQKGSKILFTMNPRAKVRVEEIDDFLKQYRNKMKIKPEANPIFVFESEGTLKKELLAKVREIIKNIHKLEK